MSVGIPEIDEDHKHFIFLINELNRSIVDRKDPAEIKKRLQIIVEDAERHFIPFLTH
jgi:hemerythrin